MLTAADNRSDNRKNRQKSGEVPGMDAMDNDSAGKPNGEITSRTAQSEHRLDGEEFNVINYEDVEEEEDGEVDSEKVKRNGADGDEKEDEDEEVEGHVDQEQEDEEDEDEEDEEDEENDFYWSSPAGLLGARMMQQRNRSATSSWGGAFDDLHPFTQLLSVSNVDDCVDLERSVDRESERCLRNTFLYRLSSCPELSLGLFSRPTLSDLEDNKTLSPRHKLIAHISATRTPSRTVTAASMTFPADWQKRRSSLPRAGEADPPGHQEQGSTVALHSFVVADAHRNKGLDDVLIKAYIERIKSAKIADRIAMLTPSASIDYYRRLGFEDQGIADVQLVGGSSGQGNTHSMILEFSEIMDD